MFRALSIAAALMVTASALAASPVLAQTLPLPHAPAPAEGPAPGTGANPDPWEHTNRKFYAIHQSIDRAILRPAALGYRKITPGPIGVGIHNVLTNLSEPVVFVNDMAQFRFSQAAGTVARILTNSTIGLLGLIDVAGMEGEPHHDNNFGVTLGVWGVRSGPYIFIPLVGPTTARDLVGKGVDSVADPFTWSQFHGDTYFSISRTVVGGLDLRANVDDQLQQLDKLSTDSYVTLRSFYLQNQQSQIQGGKIDVQNLPDFDDPVASPPPPGAPAPAGAAPKTPAADSDIPVPPADAPRT